MFIFEVLEHKVFKTLYLGFLVLLSSKLSAATFFSESYSCSNILYNGQNTNMKKCTHVDGEDYIYEDSQIKVEIRFGLLPSETVINTLPSGPVEAPYVSQEQKYLKADAQTLFILGGLKGAYKKVPGSQPKKLLTFTHLDVGPIDMADGGDGGSQYWEFGGYNQGCENYTPTSGPNGENNSHWAMNSGKDSGPQYARDYWNAQLPTRQQFIQWNRDYTMLNQSYLPVVELVNGNTTVIRWKHRLNGYRRRQPIGIEIHPSWEFPHNTSYFRAKHSIKVTNPEEFIQRYHGSESQNTAENQRFTAIADAGLFSGTKNDRNNSAAQQFGNSCHKIGEGDAARPMYADLRIEQASHAFDFPVELNEVTWPSNIAQFGEGRNPTPEEEDHWTTGSYVMKSGDYIQPDFLWFEHDMDAQPELKHAGKGVCLPVKVNKYSNGTNKTLYKGGYHIVDGVWNGSGWEYNKYGLFQRKIEDARCGFGPPDKQKKEGDVICWDSTCIEDVHKRENSVLMVPVVNTRGTSGNKVPYMIVRDPVSNYAVVRLINEHINNRASFSTFDNGSVDPIVEEYSSSISSFLGYELANWSIWPNSKNRIDPTKTNEQYHYNAGKYGNNYRNKYNIINMWNNGSPEIYLLSEEVWLGQGSVDQIRNWLKTVHNVY